MSENADRERPLHAVIIILPLLTAAGALLALLIGSAPALRFFAVPWTLTLCLVLAALLLQQQRAWMRDRLELTTLRAQDESRRNALRASTAALQAAERRLGALTGELTASAAAVTEEREQRVRFMNNVGEELRTPLNVIVNFANLLARDGAGAVDERQVDYLERIERAGWHVLEVLDDLLDLARIEEGDAQPDRELVDLQSVCEEVLAGTRGLVLGKPVQLVRDFPEACPLVYGDPVRLKQALISLLGTAARFTDEGYIALRLRPQDHTVDIVVEDTGAGRQPARTNARPGPYEQSDAALARRRAGVGLGQPLTRHLVERHGGTMTLHSAPGYDSVFSITLPLPRCEPVYEGALVAALY